jgi:hypothetical protein
MARFNAWKILKALVEGRNSRTLKLLPEESPCHDPDVIRALCYAVESLSSQNKGKIWSSEEDGELVSNYLLGMTVEELAEKHGRAVNAVEWRLFKYGELKDEE